jgi:outer membrane protein assembly factor BamB
VARARTTSILPVLLLASIAADGRVVAPEAAVQAFPTSPIRTIAVKALPVAPPVSAAGRLFLALQSGVFAHRLDDGAEVWQKAPLEVDGPMAASDERLVVAVKGELRGLDASTGGVVWTDRTGPLTAPPLVHGEWLFIASGDQVICYRVADGVRVWARETGAVEQRVAVEGTRVYVPAADGRLIALDLASGEPAWEFDIGIKPTEPLVYGGRIFVGSAAKRLCSLFLESTRKKRDDWCYPVGAAVIGRPAADATHVYYVALDNLLRANDRKSGAYLWKKDLRYRPSAGPLLVGASIAVPGSVPRVEVFETDKGTSTMQLTLATKLVTAPLLIDASDGAPARIAGITGGLANVWNVTLAGPAPAALPSLPIAPLTALPGPVIPIGKPPVPPGSPPPAASPLLRSVPASAPRTTAG